MSAPANHGASTRRPVVYGGRKIPRLSVRTLDDGTAVYEVRMRMPDGTQPRRVLEDVHTVTDAVREVENLLADRNRGLERENHVLNPTVAELLEEYIAALQARVGIRDDKRRLVQDTVDKHRTRARLHINPVLGRKRVADIATRDLRELIRRTDAKGLAPGTVSLVLQAMTGALQFAHDNGYVDRNVSRDLSTADRPGFKRQTEPRYLTKSKIEFLLAAATDYYRPIWACCAYAALRINEALGLQWECIDFKADTLFIRQQLSQATKTVVPYAKTPSSIATLPLMPALKRELLAHRSRAAAIGLQRVRPEALVFIGTRGQPLNSTGTLQALYRTATRVGLNPPGEQRVGQHDLRHSACAVALQSGAGPAEVMELMRHADSATTMRNYAGLNDEMRGAAMRRMLDAGFGA